jgi:hypothetical protein
VEHLNEVTPEMEAAAASTASLWHVVSESRALGAAEHGLRRPGQAP